MADLTAQGESRNQIDAPHIVKVGSDWYIFYSHFYPAPNYWNDTDRPAPIGLAKSTNGILGPYTQISGHLTHDRCDRHVGRRSRLGAVRDPEAERRLGHGLHG